ncbi:MAG: ComF family protein [Lachnospiraceae bacterium]|jgi:ComF family protein|nr:ComF family protein [Lachnospiraceae bacterium]MDD3616317.1 ComF family protein [Lachnospiraceae bacterium]
MSNNMSKIIGDILYPPRCPVCHEIVGKRTQLACPECLKKLPLVVEPRCKSCGKPLRNRETEYCRDCKNHSHEYTQGIGIFAYNQLMQQSIVLWKYHGRQEYGKFYAFCIKKYAAPYILRWNPQLIIPVPIHKKRRRMRGFNQAEMLGELLEKATGIPMDTTLVERTEYTKAQKKLNPEERRHNLQHAFTITRTQIPFKRILILDDIYTTGSTIDAITRLLKQAGAQEVYFITVCIGYGEA